MSMNQNANCHPKTRPTWELSIRTKYDGAFLRKFLPEKSCERGDREIEDNKRSQGSSGAFDIRISPRSRRKESE